MNTLFRLAVGWVAFSATFVVVLAASTPQIGSGRSARSQAGPLERRGFTFIRPQACPAKTTVTTGGANNTLDALVRVVDDNGNTAAEVHFKCAAVGQNIPTEPEGATQASQPDPQNDPAKWQALVPDAVCNDQGTEQGQFIAWAKWEGPMGSVSWTMESVVYCGECSQSGSPVSASWNLAHTTIERPLMWHRGVHIVRDKMLLARGATTRSSTVKLRVFSEPQQMLSPTPDEHAQSATIAGAEWQKLWRCDWASEEEKTGAIAVWSKNRDQDVWSVNYRTFRIRTR